MLGMGLETRPEHVAVARRCSTERRRRLAKREHAQGAQRPRFGVACGPMSAAVAPDDIVEQPRGRARRRTPAAARAGAAASASSTSTVSAPARSQRAADRRRALQRDLPDRARRAAHELVLRRPPRPPLPPSAHDVLREARLLRALERTAGARAERARRVRRRDADRLPLLRDGARRRAR